jgi:predicted NAD/FAD-binding protein
VVVFETDPRVGQAGSDAGIWLAPLINRKTFSMSYLADFQQASTQKKIQRHDVGYIYVGGTAQSFHETQLQNDPSLYKPVFSIPGAHVYQVLNTP